MCQLSLVHLSVGNGIRDHWVISPKLAGKASGLALGRNRLPAFNSELM